MPAWFSPRILMRSTDQAEVCVKFMRKAVPTRQMAGHACLARLTFQTLQKRKTYLQKRCERRSTGQSLTRLLRPY